MKLLLGLPRGAAGEQAMILEEGVLRLLPGREHDGDLFLETLLRARDRRVGNGRSTGEGVFDFRYGPFTGGLGETGLIHLSTYGERILAVEIDLSVKHRAVEASIEGLPLDGALSRVELVCGNFAFAHAHAFARAVEQATGIRLNERSRRLSLAALELERIYNHLYVITRLAQAAAQKVLASHLGALFEEALRTNLLFGGSRFLHGVRRIGGTAVRNDSPLEETAARVRSIAARFAGLYHSSLSSRNYLDRLHGIARIERGHAEMRSLTGPSLRATGSDADLRTREELLDGFRPVIRDEGDSLARMEVRAEEILQSCAIVEAQIAALRAGDGAPAAARNGGRKDPMAVVAGGLGAAEGASGVVAWAVATNGLTVQSAYASTPSLFGYQVFAEALTGHIFTDFPFALDSFGLSFADAAR
jgi:Ni,Fe-hydrogenase III large subunit